MYIYIYIYILIYIRRNDTYCEACTHAQWFCKAK